MCRQPLLQQEQQMVVSQDAYLTSRATAMQNVESTIHELGGIFQQLAHMVSPFLCSTHDALPRLGIGTGRLLNPLQNRAHIFLLTSSCMTASQLLLPGQGFITCACSRFVAMLSCIYAVHFII